MRVLSLDLGHKRIGLAVSDEDASIAFPAGHLDSRGRPADLKAVVELIEERQIGRVVIGLPRHMDGRLGTEAEAAKAFAEALRQASGLPVDLLDERWTSLEAERVLREQAPRKKRGAKRKTKKGAVDSVAASIILSTYLDLQRQQSKPPLDDGDNT